MMDQKESENISDNLRWSIDMRMRTGKYNALRPYRSTKQELLDIAGELDGKYGAKTAASLVREAAEVYEKRGRLKKF